MIASKRNFLTRLTGAASAVASTICSPAIARTLARRVSQSELNEAIEAHAIWLEDRSRGVRAAFSNCDLSGLDFRNDQNTLVDLRGADLSEADLSATTGHLVSFRRASLHYARLSWSRLVEPAFIDASLRGAICENAVWGWDLRPSSGSKGAEPASSAVMFNCDAGKANFRRARIRGHFLDTNFVAASLADADLSRSTFTGSHLQETTFFRADLTRARFDHAELAYVRFSQATLADADFTGATFGPRVNLPDQQHHQIV